ncbi:hypothetical protein AB0H29_21090 [Streptomyces thermolilacinus]
MALIVLTCLLASSCATGGGEESSLGPDYLCDAPEGTRVASALSETLGRGRFETTVFAMPADLVRRVEGDLRQWTPEEGALPTDVCLFQHQAADGDRSVRISFQWVSRDGQRKRGLPDATGYEVSGVAAQTNEIRSEITFPCVMPGEGRALSQRVHLMGRAAFTGERTGETREAKDVRHLTLTYLMAQRAVEALGCENKPLRGEPVVKPGT